MASGYRAPRPDWLKMFERSDVYGTRILKIPYVIERPLSSGFKATIENAMENIRRESGGRAQFIPRTDEECHLKIFEDDGCWYYLGNECFPEISLGKGCKGYGTVLHELLHALGFQHEHQRPDRDKFVEIQKHNIQEGKQDQFELVGEKDYRWNDLPFDYDSIMMYDSFAFSKNGQMTIMKKLGTMVTNHEGLIIREKIYLSYGDKEKLRQL